MCIFHKGNVKSNCLFYNPSFVALKVNLGTLSHVMILLHSTKVTIDKEVFCLIGHNNIVLGRDNCRVMERLPFDHLLLVFSYS